MNTYDSLQLPLTRSSDGYVAGVCEGLGRHFDIDPTLLRIGWLIAMVFFGTGILLYLALWWIMPPEREAAALPGHARSIGTGFGQLRRSAEDRRLFGVCGGLAEAWSIDPVFVRLGVLGATFFSGGLAVLAYAVAVFLIPNAHGSLPGRAHPVEF